MDTSFANIYIRDTYERVYVLVLGKKKKKKKRHIRFHYLIINLINMLK